MISPPERSTCQIVSTHRRHAKQLRSARRRDFLRGFPSVSEGCAGLRRCTDRARISRSVRAGAGGCYRHPKTANKRCSCKRLALTPLPENPRPTSRRGIQLGLLCKIRKRGGNGRAAAVCLGSAADAFTADPRKREALQFAVLAKLVWAGD